MNNCEKLLRAFIEVQGYEVELVATAESFSERKEYIALGCAFDPKLDYDYKITKPENTKTVDLTRIYKQ